MNARHRCLSLVTAVALCVAAPGCTGVGQSDTTKPQEATEEAAAPEASGAVPADELGGLRVTVETTSGPGPNVFDDQNSSINDTPPPEGKVRLTVVANATNSSESTLSVQIEHNFPALKDADGEYLQSVGGALTASNAPSGKFGDTGEGLGPGGVLQTVQYFDIDPGQTGFVIIWEFGDLGTYEQPLP